jgi:hypothetical protein
VVKAAQTSRKICKFKESRAQELGGHGYDTEACRAEAPGELPSLGPFDDGSQGEVDFVDLAGRGVFSTWERRLATNRRPATTNSPSEPSEARGLSFFPRPDGSIQRQINGKVLFGPPHEPLLEIKVDAIGAERLGDTEE